MRKTIECLFDLKYLKKLASGYDLSTKLKKTRKGLSVYATKPIKKNNVICYYKFKLFKMKTYNRPVRRGAYMITVYTKTKRASNTLIGDLYEGSYIAPRRNIPFWGYLANEPSLKQKANSYIDFATKDNYRKKNALKSGDTMIYKLRALRNINPGEEVVWCYGEGYHRNYSSSCSE